MKIAKNKERKSSLPGFISAFLVLLAICIFPLHAQNSDFTMWSKLKLKHNLTSVVDLSADVEMRTRDALDEIDRWGIAVATSVRLLPFLKAEGGYELHYRNRRADGWKTRHRYHVGASGILKIGRWRWSLRERLQHTFDGRGVKDFRLRSRLKAAYKINSWSPYASLEQYHSLGKDEWFRSARFRARSGVEVKFSSRWAADVFYCYQHEKDKDKHILGWELGYKF